MNQIHFLDALGFTSILSSIITTGRILVLLKASLLKDDFNNHKDREKDKETRSHLYYTRELTERFLTLTQYTKDPYPFNYLIKLRSYGLSIRYNTAEKGNSYWIDDTLIFNSIELSISDLKDFIGESVASIKLLLYQDLLFNNLEIPELRQPPPYINIRDLKDDISNSEYNFNFLEDSRNIDLKKESNYLLNKILKTSILRESFIIGYSSIEQTINWNINRLRSYFIKIRLFKEQLLVLIHLTSGAPARGTELLSIKYRNSDREGRGLFIEDGLISLVTSYHKNYRTSAKLKLIHRYISKDLSLYLIYYLWLVEPFSYSLILFLSELDLGYSLSSAVQTYRSPFIWPERARPRPDDSLYQIRKRPRRNTEAIEEIDLDIDIETVKNTSNTPFWISSNQWTSGQLSQLIYQQFIKSLGLNINLIKWRHIIIAIIRKYNIDSRIDSILPRSNFNTDSNLDYGELSESDHDIDIDLRGEIADLQSGHTKAIAEQIYARDINELPGQTASKRALYRATSCWLHRFLGLEIVDYKNKSIKTENRLIQAQKWSKYQTIDLDLILRQYFGSNSHYRAQQKPNLKLILKGFSPLLIISGTGSGKSLYFQIPSLIANLESIHSLSIVVLPFIALKLDLLARLQRLGLRVEDWGGSISSKTQILLISYESVISHRFKEFAIRQIHQNRLDRIYIDECHVILDANSEFRPKLRDLGEILDLKVQLIYLTATLPPLDLSEWLSVTGTTLDSLKILRESTIRSNIRYRVQEVDSSKLFKYFISIYKAKKQSIEPGGQIIIYCTSKRMTEKIAENISCSYFHSELNDGQKARILRDFIDQKIPVLSATNAFGVGIDSPNIRLIIHFNRPSKLRLYSQESGRAGRDGRPAEALLLGTNFSSDNSQIDSDLIDYSRSIHCRRIILDRVLDGREDRSECGESEEPCDICSNRAFNPQVLAENRVPSSIESPPSTETPPIEFRMIEKQQEGNQQIRLQEIRSIIFDLTLLELKLVQTFQECFICSRKLEKCSCQARDREKSLKKGVEIEKSLQFDRYSGCYRCYLPYQLCPRFERVGSQYRMNGAVQACRYPEILRDFLAGAILRRDEGLQEWFIQRGLKYSIQVQNEKDLYRVCGRKHQIGEVETNELVWSFWSLYRLEEKH